MNEKRQQDVAIFRYGIIAPVIHKTITGTAAEYFRNVTESELEVPHIGRTRYKPGTLKGWLAQYRAGGLEGLMPKDRIDAGIHRVITPKIEAAIEQIIREFPKLPVSVMRERLIEDGLIATRSPSESVLRRHVRRRRAHIGIEENSNPKGRRAFAKSEPNELWTLDFMHGPTIGGGKKKALLLAIIDDASRFIVLGRFLASESYAEFAPLLVDAFCRHGLPLALYCDNGSAFSSGDFRLSCARLDIALIHSKPYTPQGRGKIERFFLTVRTRFLSGLKAEDSANLESLNVAFSKWLEKDYHQRKHSGIDDAPMARFLNSGRPKRWVSRSELDLHFYHTLTRKVRSDCTISVYGTRWEVPAEYIGHKVEIRSPLDKPLELTLFSAGEPVLVLKALDKVDNDHLRSRVSFARNSSEKSS